MLRRAKIAVALLVLAVIVGVIYFPRLHQRVQRLAKPTRTEEQARREVIQPPISTPSDVKVKAKIFWASADSANALEPVDVELPLSADPVQRSKQLINALIAGAPSPARRTLPADAALLEFYLLEDGTAIADFSDTLATATPSGILSEQLAVDSISRTLAANVEAVLRLKILIHGQDADTLSGHLDLTGFFPVRAAGLAPATEKPSGQKAPAKSSGLTPSSMPGKLGH